MSAAMHHQHLSSSHADGALAMDHQYAAAGRMSSITQLLNPTPSASGAVLVSVSGSPLASDQHAFHSQGTHMRQETPYTLRPAEWQTEDSGQMHGSAERYGEHHNSSSSSYGPPQEYHAYPSSNGYSAIHSYDARHHHATSTSDRTKNSSSSSGTGWITGYTHTPNGRQVQLAYSQERTVPTASLEEPSSITQEVDSSSHSSPSQVPFYVSAHEPPSSRSEHYSRPYSPGLQQHQQQEQEQRQQQQYRSPDMQLQQHPQHSAASWQSSERASTRIAARDSAAQGQNQAAQQLSGIAPVYVVHPGYPPPPYRYVAYSGHGYSSPMAHSSTAPTSTSQIHSADSTSSRKRASSMREGEDSAPQSKKTKGQAPESGPALAKKPKSKKKDASAKPPISHAASADPSTLRPELQFARCMSNRYKQDEFPKCVSCTRRWAGDTCRFQNIRYFMRDGTNAIKAFSFAESHDEPEESKLAFPTLFNVPLEPRHLNRVKRTVAKALLPILQAEREHLKQPMVIVRQREVDVRATCDTCMTSIFSASFMCRMCGRELCSDCYQRVEELTVPRSDWDSAQIAAQQARRERVSAGSNLFLCNRRVEHDTKTFFPMTRFAKQQLAQAVEKMEALLASEDEFDAENPTVDSSVIQLRQDPRPATGADQSTAAEPSLYIDSHPTRYINQQDLDEPLFRSIWSEGQPLVVDRLEPFKLPWTPEYFRQAFGSTPCQIVNCEPDSDSRKTGKENTLSTTVGNFFEAFGDYNRDDAIMKLKDWPPTEDFRKAFPLLYDDFCSVVPVPSYVMREGAYNIASHFPTNAVAPDLGPKMYSAFATSDVAGSHGSTRLHMDMADAVNIMTFACKASDGSEGCAAWDIFKASDSDRVRQFLREKFSVDDKHDPIHSQQYYLGSTLRKQLLDQLGVKSHRIYQRPGQAVFIPAGCAHQVANFADCIKIAIDFVSPENIERCEQLTREFRAQNHSRVWKEDILQLRSMMWFAWLSCCHREKVAQ